MSSSLPTIEAVARGYCERDLRRAGTPEGELSIAVDRYWHCVAADLEAGLFDDAGHLVAHNYDNGLAAYRDWLQRHGPEPLTSDNLRSRKPSPRVSWQPQKKGAAMKRAITAAACAAILMGCAQRADEIPPSYVSPLAYESYTCQQIFEESKRVSARAASVAGVQDSQASNDAVAMGVGLVVFWPALFFIGGQDQSAELARLKGEKDALEQAAIRKNCGIDFRPAPA